MDTDCKRYLSGGSCRQAFLRLHGELTEHEKYILDLAREAVDYWNRGDPVKDAIEDNEINEALELLVKLADNNNLSGRRKWI